MEVALGAVVKNEFIDLLDWLVYHQVAGISKFYVADDSSFDGTLELMEAMSGVFPIAITRGFDRNGKAQLNAYKSVLDVLQEEICIFLDADEYLYSEATLRPAQVLGDFFADASVSAVAINWQLIGHDESWVSQYGAGIRRIGRQSDTSFKTNMHLKTAVRKSDVKLMEIHNAKLSRGRYLLVDGSEHMGKGAFSPTVLHEPLRILHFAANGSYENFLLRRAWRGDISAPKLPPEAKVNRKFYDHHNPTGPAFEITPAHRLEFDKTWNSVVKRLVSETLLMHEIQLKVLSHAKDLRPQVTLEVTCESNESALVGVESLSQGKVYGTGTVRLSNGRGEVTLRIPRGQEAEIRILGSLSGRLVLEKKGNQILEDQKFAELTLRLARAERLLLQERLKNVELENQLKNQKPEKQPQKPKKSSASR